MKTPVHLWIVGALSLLWNIGGAYDYLMTSLRDEAYLSNLSPDMLAYITSAPAWFVVAWATGVWFSVAGSLLLLARSRFAAPIFALSLLGLLIGTIYSYAIASPSVFAMAGTFQLLFTALIFVVLVGLWLYARAMTRSGVLR